MDKKTLSERDICTKFITPALEASGWDRTTQFLEEVNLTSGRVVVRGNKAKRDEKTIRRDDYVLYFKSGVPIAVIEATISSMKNVSREVILTLPVPVPPKAEQSRIVACVTELRTLCARLSERLAATENTQSLLADALLEQVIT